MSKTVEQALWYPSAMLEELQEIARKHDKSVAWCVQQAWSLAKREVQGLHGNSTWRAEKVFEKRYADADKVKHSLSLPRSMMDEIKNEAARLDRSMSWLVARSFCVTREKIGQSKSATTGA
jgi:uncharacterized small protein (TIGR04563 family)